MKNLRWSRTGAAGLIGFVCILLGNASPAQAVSEDTNPMFGYTHLLPSPVTLPSGRLVFGTDLAYGLTDFLQVGTGILRDFYKFYNANAKISFIDYPEFAFSLTGGWEHYNLKEISSKNPDLSVTSWTPGATTAISLMPQLAWFNGGNLNFTNTQLKTDGVVTSGFLRGASVESDLSWAYNPPGARNSKSGRGKKAAPQREPDAVRRGGVGNVLSVGASYDLTYKIYGIGISHHWPGFHIGVHYYPNANENRLLPILSGGGSIDF